MSCMYVFSLSGKFIENGFMDSHWISNPGGPGQWPFCDFDLYLKNKTLDEFHVTEFFAPRREFGIIYYYMYNLIGARWLFWLHGCMFTPSCDTAPLSLVNFCVQQNRSVY